MAMIDELQVLFTALTDAFNGLKSILASLTLIGREMLFRRRSGFFTMLAIETVQRGARPTIELTVTACCTLRCRQFPDRTDRADAPEERAGPPRSTEGAVGGKRWPVVRRASPRLDYSFIFMKVGPQLP